MKVIVDNLWLCQDCAIVAVNADYSGIEDEARCDEIDRCLAALRGLVPDSGEDGEGDDEFSWQSCDCCDNNLGGSRMRFVQLGE